MISNPSHTLIFGGITMVEEGANPPDGSGVRYLVQSQDTTFGNPVPVTVALISLMRVGSLVSYDHTENRAPVLRVTIEADDSDLLARGERALQLECERPNTLTWVPPDGAGERSVFDVVWSSLEFAFDDVQELLRRRVYLVRLQTLPHARTEALVVTPAQGTATETLIDDGSSVTGWSVVTGESVVSTAGAIVLTTNVPPTSGFSAHAVAGQVRRTGVVSLTTARYIKVIWTTSDPPTAGLFAYVDGVLLTEAQRATSGGFTESFFALPPGVISAATIDLLVNWTNVTVAQTLSIDNVSQWTGLPFIGTARQKAMSLIPGGSVTADGSLTVEHASNALGKAIVFTHPSGTGYLPPLRVWRFSGTAPTSDSSTLSGSRNPIVTPSVYQVPVSAAPRGRTELWAWLRNPNAVNIRIDSAVVSVMNSFAVGASQTGQVDVAFAANTWQLVLLGVFTLPPSDLGPSGSVQVQIARGTTAETPEVDEAYLFATDLGRLTVVDCGTGSPVAGGPSNRLWIDAPSSDQPQGGVWRGNAADRSDAWHAGSAAAVWEVHTFDPLGTSVFVATQDTIDAPTSLEHYKRFHTHVARDD